MKNTAMKFCLAAITAVAISVTTAGAQTVQPSRTTATYDAWTLVWSFYPSSKVAKGIGTGTAGTSGGDAGKTAEKPKTVRICEVVQTYGAGKRSAQLALVPAPKNPKAAVAAFRVPVDVLLPFGASISVDDTDIAKGQFIRCMDGRCVANFSFDEKTFEALAGAKAATLVYKQSRVGWLISRSPAAA